MKSIFLAILFFIFAHTTNAQILIGIKDSSEKQILSPSQNIQLLYGNSSINVNNFIVLDGCFVLYDWEKSELTLLDSATNLVLDKFNLFSIKELKSTIFDEKHKNHATFPRNTFDIIDNVTFRFGYMITNDKKLLTLVVSIKNCKFQIQKQTNTFENGKIEFYNSSIYSITDYIEFENKKYIAFSNDGLEDISKKKDDFFKRHSAIYSEVLPNKFEKIYSGKEYSKISLIKHNIGLVLDEIKSDSINFIKNSTMIRLPKPDPLNTFNFYFYLQDNDKTYIINSKSTENIRRYDIYELAQTEAFKLNFIKSITIPKEYHLKQISYNTLYLIRYIKEEDANYIYKTTF